MALFLNESVAVGTQVTLMEAMTSLLESQQEIGNFTEAMLRADFVIHEQKRNLSEAEAEGKEKGFLAKVWEAIVALAKKVWAALVSVYNWIKNAAQKMWAYIREKFAGAKTFVIAKAKWLKAKACEVYQKAKAAVRAKIAALIGGTVDNSEIQDKVRGYQQEMSKIDADYKAATAAAEKGDGEVEISESDLKGIIDALQGQLDGMTAETKKIEATAAAGKGNGASAAQVVLNDANKSAASAASAVSSVTSGVKPSKKK